MCKELLQHQSCYIDFQVGYSDIFDYNIPLDVNIFDASSLSLVNPEFGNIKLIASKKSIDTTVKLADLELTITPAVDFIKASYTSPRITKRYYIKNIGNRLIKVPNINLPTDLNLSKNMCDTILVMNQTCFFDIDYLYTTDSSKISYQESIKFSTTDPLLDTSKMEILLNITNTDNYVPSVLDVTIPNIPSMNSTNNYRIYYKNNGSKSIIGSPSMAHPYNIIKTNCLLLQPGWSCYVDFSITKLDNVVGLNLPINYGGIESDVKAGIVTSKNSILCSSEYVYYKNNCVMLSQSQSCTLTNGVGLQSSEDAGITWGQCFVTYCNSGYAVGLNNDCVPLNQTKNCSFAYFPGPLWWSTDPIHGAVLQPVRTSNDGGKTWGACVGKICTHGIVPAMHFCSLGWSTP
jgi:hypothetical protein